MNLLKKISPILFLLITVVTLLLTLLPANKLGKNDLFQYDKIGHFALFFGWTLFFGLTAIFRQWNQFAHLAVLLVTALVFGFLIEVIQLWVPLGRSFDWQDWIADAIGSLVAIGLLYFLKQKQQTYKNNGVTN
jgi:VanZ family protein